MRIIIAGGSGLVGRALTENLTKRGHDVVILSRDPARVIGLPNGANAVAWDGRTSSGWGNLVEGAEIIVNLAGENLKGKGLLPKRWNASRKTKIRQSRLDAGSAVVEAIKHARQRPRLLVQASSVGFYGSQDDKQITESTPPGTDFLAKVCVDWENSTVEVEALGVRRVVLRTGLLLTLKGGSFPSLLLPFRLFLGNTFGSGKQYYSWIHFEDCIAALQFLIDDPRSTGVYNLTAPNPVTNREFARTLGQVMHRPSFFNLPRFTIEIPFGDVATVVMDGQRVLPIRLQEAGFDFRFPDLEPALRDLL